MDLITQGILGAAVSQVGFQKTLGRKALFWGAIIGMVPDLDVLVRFSSNPFAEILYHRGVTHSLWFGPVLGPLIGYLLWRWYRRKQTANSLSAWIGLAIWALLTHPLLDLFTVYGTQLLAPFSNHRFTLSAVPIIDPIYSLTLLLAVSLGFFFYRKIKLVVIGAAVALTLTTGYLFLGLAQNEKAEFIAQQQLSQEFPGKTFNVQAYTTFLQLFWRRLVVEDNEHIRVGFLSTLYPKSIEWETFEKPKNFPSFKFLNDPSVAIFTWFTSQRYSLSYEPNSNEVTLKDNRFGLPGPTTLGLWGIKFKIDNQGKVISPIEKIRVPTPSISMNLILGIFQKAFF